MKHRISSRSMARTAAGIGAETSVEVASNSSSRQPEVNTTPVDSHGLEVNISLAGFPIKPYSLRPRIAEQPAGDEHIPNKRPVVFSGSVMDNQDAQWYEDVNARATVVVHPSSASSSATPCLAPPADVSTTGTKRSRKLVRFNSEQAIDLFHHLDNADISDDEI